MPLERCQSCRNVVDQDSLSRHTKFGYLCHGCYGVAYQLEDLVEQIASLNKSSSSNPLRLELKSQLQRLAKELSQRIHDREKEDPKGPAPSKSVRPHLQVPRLGGRAT